MVLHSKCKHSGVLVFGVLMGIVVLLSHVSCVNSSSADLLMAHNAFEPEKQKIEDTFDVTGNGNTNNAAPQSVRAGLEDDEEEILNEGIWNENPAPCVATSLCVPSSASLHMHESTHPRHDDKAAYAGRRRYFHAGHWTENTAREMRLINSVQTLREELVARLKETIGEEEWEKAEMKVVPIDRKKAEDFTYEDFYTNYALKRIPVVIENANFSRVPFTLDYWRQKCGDKKVMPTVMAANSTGGWGQLTYLPEVTLEEFVSAIMKRRKEENDKIQHTDNNHTNDNGTTPSFAGRTLHSEARPYVFDWSLPHNCPEILKDFIVPKYFAQDLFQNLDPEWYKYVTVPNYRESWPSLFIGPKGAQSAMHVDSAGTSFWMGMMSGKKHWRIFPNSRHMLYEEETHTFAANSLKPDYERYPLLKMAIAYDAYIGAGDAIYVPGGSPHKVVTTEDGVSLSMNFYDHAVRESAMETNHDVGETGTLMLRALLDHPEIPKHPKLDGYGNEDQPWENYKNPPVKVTPNSLAGMPILYDEKNDAVEMFKNLANGDRFLIFSATDGWVANIMMPKLWGIMKKWRENSNSTDFNYLGAHALHTRRLMPKIETVWAWALRLTELREDMNLEQSWFVYVNQGCVNITEMLWTVRAEDLIDFMRHSDAQIAGGHCFPVWTIANNEGMLWRLRQTRLLMFLGRLFDVEFWDVYTYWRAEIEGIYGLFTFAEGASYVPAIDYLISLCLAAALHAIGVKAWRRWKRTREAKRQKGQVRKGK